MREWVEPALKMGVVLGGVYAAVGVFAVCERSVGKALEGRGWPRWPGREGWRKIAGLSWGLLVEQFTLLQRLQPLTARVAAFVGLVAATLVFAAIPFGEVLPGFGGAEPVALILLPGTDTGGLLVLALFALSLAATAIAAERRDPAGSDDRRWGVLPYLPLLWGLALVPVALLSGSLQLETMAARQAEAGVWWMLVHPVGFLLFAGAGCVLAVQGPLPTEDVDGEKSGRNCSAEILTGALHRVAFAYLLVLMFCGGWHFWGVTPGGAAETATFWGGVLRVGVLHVKVIWVVLGLIVLRWAWPRFRGRVVAALRERGVIADDGVGFELAVAVKGLLPLGLVNVLVAAAAHDLGGAGAYTRQALVGWGLLAVGVVGVWMLSRPGLRSTGGSEG